MMGVDDGGSGLLNVLSRLVRVLEPSRGGRPVLEGRGDKAPEHWQDDDYVDVQAIIANNCEEEIDISIHGGLVFIRIVR